MRELRDSKGRFVAGHKKVGGMPKGGHQTEEAKNKISASLIGRKESVRIGLCFAHLAIEKLTWERKSYA